jgi:hypothetical protein
MKKKSLRLLVVTGVIFFRDNQKGELCELLSASLLPAATGGYIDKKDLDLPTLRQLIDDVIT